MNPLFLITHKKKLTVGSVLLASVLLFGFNGTWDRLSVALDQARGKADEIMPTDTLLSLARKQLTTAEQRLLEAEAATGSQGQENRLRQGITRLESAAAEARRRLETLRPALASTAVFAHCGSQYSQSEVRQDALRLATFIQECEATVTTRKAEPKELENAASGGNETLTAARQDFQEAKARFAELEIRLKQQQALAAATESVRAARSGLNEELEGDFARTLAVLDKRLGKLQRQNETLRADQGGVPAGNVRFEAAAADPAALVDRVLGKPVASAN
jgi:chromosome segregation ATPase